MALIDELKLHIKAGDGGDGVVRWRREKYIDMGGPNGGNGGNGGGVFIEAVRDVSALKSYSLNPKIKAKNGEPGRGRSQFGKNGEDLIMKLPVGTYLKNENTEEEYDLTSVGQKIQILRGGRGGLGNEHFKSSTNTTPYEWTPGKEGGNSNFYVELRLFADVGLVGFPNAGKSSLLNSLTNANSRIESYAFTTLDPHLGVFQEFVIADIPGIIEGASTGKGLGTKFLKHISRTKMLVHLVSFENEDMVSKYKAIRKELENFGRGLEKKEEVILLTKTDVTTDKEIEKVKNTFKKLGKEVFTVTMFDDGDVKNFGDELVKILRK
jgi:GTP-binding protein